MNLDRQTLGQDGVMQNRNFRFFELKNHSPKVLQNTLKKLLKILEKEQWILDMGAYTTSNFKAIISHISQSKCVKLWLGYNARPNIIKQISTADFPYLKQLSLAHNQIYSVEVISALNFPKLQELQFRQNVITSLKSFKKLSLPQLKVISFYRNSIKETLPLCEIPAKNVKTIWLQYEDDEPVQGQTIAFLSKLQSSQLKSMAAATSQRIKEPKLEKTLTKKFPNFKIYRSSK